MGCGNSREPGDGLAAVVGVGVGVAANPNPNEQETLETPKPPAPPAPEEAKLIEWAPSEETIATLDQTVKQMDDFLSKSGDAVDNADVAIAIGNGLWCAPFHRPSSPPPKTLKLVSRTVAGGGGTAPASRSVQLWSACI